MIQAAEELCAQRLERIAEPTQYIAGFRTKLGRELAIERERNVIYCWAEHVVKDGAPGSPSRHYPADKSRNSNLNGKNSPRLREGRAVDYWVFDTLPAFARFLDWYDIADVPNQVNPIGTNIGIAVGYQITTIAETLNRINKDLFIPAIQRPYVWTPEQITLLFDSLMRGYPMGALMFWDLPLESYDDWEVYRFIEEFRMGSIHNDRADPAHGQPVTLVLDGQQRLTSLLIGLKGSYTVKQKHKRKSSAEHWDEKILFIDLAHSPEPSEEGEEDDVSPVAEHYRFQFFDHDQRPHNRQGELWFEVGLVLAARSESERDSLVRNWAEANLDLEEWRRAIVARNLTRLWEAVWRDQAITYFTESSDSYDRVLDIFIRANDGETRLSRSDLLMSVITLRWEQFNAREETEQLIDDLTLKLDPRRAITREFVLRTALFLNDLEFSIKVQNFVPKNIRLLEQSWERVKAVLRFSAEFLREHGFHGENLSGTNILMLVAYYVHKRHDGQGPPQLASEDRQRIRRWLIMISFQGLLGLQTGSTFKAYRNAVRRALRDGEHFPWQPVADAFKGMGRSIDFTSESLGRWCNTSVDQPQAEMLLSLLHEDSLVNLRRRLLPIVQSRFFSPDELRRAGVEDGLAPVLLGFANKLILGVALNATEQEQYYALPFEQWAQTLSPQFMESQCLPANIALYRMDRLPEWVSERRKLLLMRLSGLAELSPPQCPVHVAVSVG